MIRSTVGLKMGWWDEGGSKVGVSTGEITLGDLMVLGKMSVSSNEQSDDLG